jgi:hypothetical protein
MFPHSKTHVIFSCTGRKSMYPKATLWNPMQKQLRAKHHI